MSITSRRIKIMYAVTIFYVLLLTVPSGTNNIVNSTVESNNTNGSLVVNGISTAPSTESITQQTNKIIDDNEKTINVLASFYPIYEFVNEIGGDKVEATTLIPIGIEPHDYEPTIQQIQQAENADIIFFNGLNFEGSWINRINNDNLVVTSKGLNITKENVSRVNPHIWLDPILAKNQVKNIEESLIKIDPTNKEYYQKNAINFTGKLDSLDALIGSTLQTCEKKDFIAFHDAFSYFADRYGLKQHSITGVAPEGEVLPQRIQEIIELAKELGINVIYSEELVDPRFAEVIAQEIPDGKVLILSPIEGIEEEEQERGVGFIDKMKENLNNLKQGLKCV
jgi:zinc transport system substrate-binding protein